MGGLKAQCFGLLAAVQAPSTVGLARGCVAENIKQACRALAGSGASSKRRRTGTRLRGCENTKQACGAPTAVPSCCEMMRRTSIGMARGCVAENIKQASGASHRRAQLLRDDAQDVRRQRRELEAALGGRCAAGQGTIQAARCSGALRQTCSRVSTH